MDRVRAVRREPSAAREPLVRAVASAGLTRDDVDPVRVYREDRVQSAFGMAGRPLLACILATFEQG